MIKNNSNYWQNKLTLWLHDPVCKVFDIPHHEEIAKRIAELLFQSIPEKNNYQVADSIASSLARIILPSYKEGGAINFSDNTQIVHPLVKKSLPVELPSVDIEKLCSEIEELLKKDLGLEKSYEELQNLPNEEKPLNAFFNYKDSPEDWAKALFNYLFFAFQRRLKKENIGGLGAIWDILPADTRMPDHPLWHHLGLVSAIGSSLNEDENNQIDLVVFSITPVQDFIAKARKLRDYWSGSVLLSYLTFTGMTSVIENLGPDHVIYPSLHNQPLVDSFISEKYKISKNFLTETDEIYDILKDTKGIAAFPNKFIFICPHSKVQKMASEITACVQEKWIYISSGIKDYIQKIANPNQNFANLFDGQVKDFWKFSWASSKLAELSDKDALSKLVSGDVVENEFEVLNSFASPYPIKNVRLYTSTHSLIQSLLASGKNKPSKIPCSQNGEKCSICGEREVLNDFNLSKNSSAKDYSNNIKDFWQKLLESDSQNKNIRENEKLCAICAIKRFLPIMSDKFSKDSILREIFKSRNGKNFPSTTEMAAKRFISKIPEDFSKEEKQKLLQYLHDEDDFIDESVDFENKLSSYKKQGINFTDKDKYYAVLLMDGDKMGDLINGETFEATYKDIIHPDLAKKIENGSVKADILKKYFSKKRNLNPALHAMISDSLNNFARFGVQPAVKRANGELIYAGGDDVCAVLPLENAVTCAEEIAKSYTLSFAQYSKDGCSELQKLDQSVKKVGYHLGNGAKGISISGAIIIAHHKESLKDVIQDSHKVLDSIAKEKTGRNALAIRLKKRSGGDRDFSCKWNSINPFDGEKTILDSFKNVCRAVQENQISTSFLYHLKDLSQFFEALLEISEDNKSAILKILEYELSHSGTKTGNLEEYTKDLAGICFQKTENNRFDYNFDSAIIANFLGEVE